ncbi:MAG: 50S ribosomal protein L10 [Lentisphaeria bacterium]|nr:50S ribosomal protein L10 [Lentisphaeria bacterium]
MRPEKQQLAQDIRALIDSSSSLFLISYKGLTTAAFGELRRVLDPVGSECHVVPNRLFRIAASESGLTTVADIDLREDTALVTGGSDPVAVAKVLRDFAKDHPQTSIKLGVLEGRLCTAAEAVSLAGLPPREVLLAQLLGLLQAPASQLVRVLQAKVASVVYVLSAYLNEKEKAA